MTAGSWGYDSSSEFTLAPPQVQMQAAWVALPGGALVRADQVAGISSFGQNILVHLVGGEHISLTKTTVAEVADALLGAEAEPE